MATIDLKVPQRTHITLEYSGKDPYVLPKVALGVDGTGKSRSVAYRLEPGDNEVPLAYYHAVGGYSDVCRMIGEGIIKPVCRKHTWLEGPVAPYSSTSHDPARHCRDCGTPRPDEAEVISAGKSPPPAPLASVPDSDPGPSAA